MILEPGPDALPHMFLRGFRAPPGGTADNNPVAEEVGVFVARQVIGTDGQARDPGDLLSEDTPFDPPKSKTGPFRLEAELATTKPELDVVIVDDLDDILTIADFNSIGLNGPADLNGLADPEMLNDLAGLLVTKSFGFVRIDSGSGFGAAIARNYGWSPRASLPRKGLAGRAGPASDPAALAKFDAKLFKLPARYFNEFNAGNAVPGGSPLAPGNRLRFEAGGPNPPVVTVPAGPSLSVTQNDKPLDPSLELTPKVDTVVFDRADGSFTLVWRAVFPWETRYESATLAVA